VLLQIVSGLYGTVRTIISALTWRDYVEISIIFYAVYVFLRWVGRDANQPLLIYCYIYMGFIAFSYFLYLPVLYFILVLFLPICLVIFLLLHQKTLQKNFISFNTARITSERVPSQEWQEILVRAALVACNQKKDCFFVIERSKSLNDFLESPYFLQAEVNKDFLDVLIESVNPVACMILISNGLITSVKSRWKVTYPKESDGTPSKLHTNESTALILSENTDCIVLYSLHNKPGLNLIAQGTLTPNLSAHQVTTLFKHYYKNSVNNESTHGKRSVKTLE